MELRISRIKFNKMLDLVIDFDQKSGAVYCRDLSTGDAWSYGSRQSFFEEMRPWLARQGYYI